MMLFNDTDNYWKMKVLRETTYRDIVTALVEGFDSSDTMRPIVPLKKARELSIDLYNVLQTN